MSAPLAIDLFCGLGGWTDGLLAEGYRVVGFDNERHQYGDAKYHAQLVLQDVLTIDGAQFKHAALIVASPPCQAYSYRAMPWKRAKALPPPDNSLFEACFRIQREASDAAGHHIPLVVENVRGAQKWVGRSRWHFGSFHLWGDIPALMPMVRARAKRPGHDWNRFKETGEVSPHWRTNGEDSVKEYPEFLKATSGDCFNDPTWPGKQGGTKQPGIGGLRKNGKGDGWFQDGAVQHGSRSPARKAASAHIAKIPLPLARHIARAWWPVTC